MTACTGDELADYEPQLVVEGWIDSGGQPIVIVSLPVALSNDYKSLLSLSEYLIRDAKVQVSDGERTVTLRGRYDGRYFPPYIYTTTQMTGEPLKSYKLTVDYKEFHAEAITTIPKPMEIKSLSYQQDPSDKDKYSVRAYLDTDVEQGEYFKFFTATRNEDNPDPIFYATFMGTYNRHRVLSEGYAIVYCGNPQMDLRFSPFFAYGDDVTVKLATINEDSYLFWYNAEQAFNLGRNPLFPTAINAHNTIQGGMGYWCGYGCSFANITIE